MKQKASKLKNGHEFSLFVDNMILCIENIKDPSEKLIELINKFRKFAQNL
jgi:hypothetical protein